MLKGKTAIVTGSTSGIGQGIAFALAAEGCNLVINGFGDRTQIEAECKQIEQKYAIRTHYSAADMSKPDQVRGMVEEAKKAFGSVDILVNNAGIQFTAPVEDFPDDKWEAIIAINLSAAFYAIKAAMPHMKQAKWGRVINVASAHGLVASAHKAAYVAAKHGIIGLTKVVALEGANEGVTANAICPGWVYTPLVEKQITDRAKQSGRSVEEEKNDLLREKQPMLKFSTPEELGKLAAFLCSDAAQTITGTSMVMDGGWTAQ